MREAKVSGMGHRRPRFKEKKESECGTGAQRAAPDEGNRRWEPRRDLLCPQAWVFLILHDFVFHLYRCSLLPSTLRHFNVLVQGLHLTRH